jgi:hypothetical protein
MILLFTDYSVSDPYCGLMKAAIVESVPDAAIVDVLHHAPDFNILASAHLLASTSARFPVGSVCLAVIDPGVGSERAAVVMLADEKWYIGPDNGLLSVVAGRAKQIELWQIDWRPESMSVSFHGRDVFAPIAALIEKGTFPDAKLSSIARLQFSLDSGDLYEVIYIDHYGNLISGVRAAQIPRGTQFSLASCLIDFAPVFSQSEPDRPFWYENSLGLVEFALNGGSAAQFFSAQVGDQFEIGLPA